MTIRKMQEKDVSAVMVIEEINQVAPWTEEIFLRCLRTGCHGWIKEVDAKIVGFVLYSVHVEECHILNVCVDRQYTRQGFGRELMLLALSQAKAQHAAVAYLEVRRTNSKAIRLYKNLGFKQIGERKGYYPVPSGREDALVFAVDLQVIY